MDTEDHREIRNAVAHIMREDGTEIDVPVNLATVTYEQERPSDAPDMKILVDCPSFCCSFSLTHESAVNLRHHILMHTNNNYRRRNGKAPYRRRAYFRAHVNQIRHQTPRERNAATVGAWLSYYETNHTTEDMFLHIDMPRSIRAVNMYGDEVLSVGRGWRYDYRRWKKDHDCFNHRQGMPHKQLEGFEKGWAIMEKTLEGNDEQN